MLNKAVFQGRLTADPVLRATTSGNEVCSFKIAVGRIPSKDKNAVDADFFTCVAWNKTAKFICDYFVKGQMILVFGSMRNRTYIDGNDIKRTVCELVVDEAEFCGRKNQQATEGKATDEKPIVGYSNVSVGDFEEIGTDEDFPF